MMAFYELHETNQPPNDMFYLVCYHISTNMSVKLLDCIGSIPRVACIHDPWYLIASMFSI